jgi:apolipoprotein N-acyltransferase
MGKKKKKKKSAETVKAEPRALWKKAAELAAMPVSGAAIVLAFAPYNQFYLAWAALVPLLWTLRRANCAGAALRGYLFGMGYLAALFWWLVVVRWPAPLGYAAFVVVVPAIFIPWACLTAFFMKKASGAIRVFAPACLWTLLEFAMSHGTFALPWWSLAYTQTSNLVTAQLASLGGIYLVSFMVVLANMFILAIVNKSVAADKRTWAAAGVIASASIVYGIYGLTVSHTTADPVSIALIQANFEEQEEKENQSIFTEMYSTHFEMTDEAVREKEPDIVVWSESVTFIPWLAGERNLESVKNALSSLGITLVAGVYDWKDDSENYNSVIAIDPEKGLIGKYDKIQIVPFGEMFPYRKVVEKISPAAGAWIKKQALSYDTTPGKSLTVFDSRSGKFGAMVCFESVFPGLTRKLANEGAEFLFVLTNDAWFLDTAAIHQHASMSALRAIETRRYVAQASNTGVSAIYDPAGRLAETVRPLTKDILYGEIRPNQAATFYMRFGDLFAWLCAAFSAAALALAIPRKKRS